MKKEELYQWMKSQGLIKTYQMEEEIEDDPEVFEDDLEKTTEGY